MSKNKVIVLPISTYASLNRDLFPIIRSKKVDLENASISIEVSPEYEDIFKIIQVDSDKNNERNNIRRNYNYKNLFNVLEKSAIPKSSDVVINATGELQYFKYKDQPVIPTKEFVGMINSLKSDFKTIELNAGIGQIGEITGIPSYDPKVFEPHNKRLFEMFQNYTAFPEMKIWKKKYEILYMDFLNEKNAIELVGEGNYEMVDREHGMYFEIPVNNINKQVLVDLQNIGAIQLIDGNYCIFMNDIEPYLDTFSTTEKIYEKQVQSKSGTVDLTNAIHLLNKTIHVYYDGYSDHSIKQQILFAMSFIDFDKMCADIAKSQSFMAKDLERDDIVKFTTYEDFIPKTVEEFKQYKEFVIEQDTDYYTVKIDELKKTSRTEEEFDELLAGILINSISLNKHGLYHLFKYNTYLEGFVDDIDDPAEMTDYDYDWLSTQYSNTSRLLIIYLKQQNRFVYKKVARAKGSVLRLSIHDEKLMINYHLGISNSIVYPERVKKAKYTDVVGKEFERNEEGIIISYNPSDIFNAKKIFEQSKKVLILLVAREESLGRMNFYKGYHYAILNSATPFVVSPYSSAADPSKDILIVLKHRKNKFSFSDFAQKNNLKTISSNC